MTFRAWRFAPALVVALAACAHGQDTQGVLIIGDSPACSPNNRHTCPLGVAIQSYLNDRVSMRVCACAFLR